MRRFEMFLNGVWHDITGLYVPASYTLQSVATNGDYKSSLSSCSFRIRFDQRLNDAVVAMREPVPVRVFNDIDIEFLGRMDPVFTAYWDGDFRPDDITVECVDFTAKLDDLVEQSASYPNVVGGTPFWIYNRDDREHSILFRVLEIAGLAGNIDRNAPSIMQTVKHAAWSIGDLTYRSIIDNLLGDYGWVLLSHADRITWTRTAWAEIGRVDDILPEDICGTVSRNRDYIVQNGVNVEWSQTKVMEDALLWRGNLPIGDTSNPRPGEPIAAGDFWPEDSDIIETWQKFGVDYLDTEWLEGKTRIKNDELAIVSSSDWVLKDSRDEGVVIDPIDEDNEIVYEALRARLRYRNSTDITQRLYYSQINGRALVKTHKITTSLPEGCTNPETVQTTYIYDSDSADRLARIRWMWMCEGCFTFSFSSMRTLVPGEVYRLRQGDLYDGHVLLQSMRVKDGSGLTTYTATSTAAFRNLPTSSIGSQGSGNASPGQDGSSYTNAYKRSFEKPARPTGSQPTGWTLDVWPEGSEPLWQSSAKFDSTGKMVVEWTDPVRVSGVPAPETRYIYRRAYNKPETPVGESPAGWTFDRIPDGYEPVWQSIGQFGETGNLVGSWTEPVRVSGQNLGGYRGARDTLPSDPQDGDFILYTGPSAGDLVQYHAYKYVAIDGQWVETTESDKIMALQKDALQIAKDTGEVIYAAMLYVDLLVARKLMIGGGTEYSGLLVRFLDDDGTGKPVIEIRNNEQKLFWLDFDTGLLYANFAKVVQYLPYTFNDSLQNGMPATFAFFVPEGEFGGIKIRVIGQRYRTYNSTTTTKENLGGTCSGSVFGSGHGTSSGGSVTVTINGTLNGLINVNNHNHDLSLGIIEGDMPSNMTLSFDNAGDGSFGPQIAISSGQEITEHEYEQLGGLTPNGWKQIRISSSSQGRVQVQVIVKMMIDTAIW